MELEERRARILWGQHLTAPAGQRTVCRDLNGIQAQFLSSAVHNLAARTGGGPEPEQLVKSWTVRGTVHLFHPDDLPLFLHKGRNRFLRPVDRMEADRFITLARKQYFADLILDRLAERPLKREELRLACREAGMTETEEKSVFDGWGGTLRHLAEAGQIVHGAAEDKTFQLCPPFTPMEEEAARTEMARRYFAHFGPATVRDAAYYFGKPQRDVKKWMAQLPLEHGAADGKDCFWIDNGRRDWPEPPECLFLAHFDQLLLGYEKTESLFLPREYLREVFNLSGIVMPVVLLRGRVAGRWRQKGGRLTLAPFGNWAAKDKKAVLRLAERLWTVKKVIWER